MKKITLTALVLLVGVYSIAQGNFNFGLESHADYSEVIFSNNNYPYIEESGNYNYGGGIFTEYNVGGNLSFSLGVGYTRVSSKTPKYGNTWISYSGGSMNSSSSDEIRYIYKHSYVAVPLLIHYKIGQNFRLSIGEITNISISINITTKTYSSGNASSVTNPETGIDFKTIVPCGYLGFGWDFWHLNNSVVFLQPFCSYQLTYIVNNAPLNRKFLSAGLSIGYRL